MTPLALFLYMLAFAFGLMPVVVAAVIGLIVYRHVTTPKVEPATEESKSK